MFLLPLPILPPLLNLLPFPILPLAQFHLDRPASQPALIHLPNGAGTILGIHDANEAVAARLPVGLVEHDAGHGERRIFLEMFLEMMLLEILGEVAHEETEVVRGPLGEGWVRPGRSRGGSDVCLAGAVVEGGWGGWWQRRRIILLVDVVVIRLGIEMVWGRRRRGGNGIISKRRCGVVGGGRTGWKGRGDGNYRHGRCHDGLHAFCRSSLMMLILRFRLGRRRSRLVNIRCGGGGGGGRHGR